MAGYFDICFSFLKKSWIIRSSRQIREINCSRGIKYQVLFIRYGAPRLIWLDAETSNCNQTHFWSALLLINCNWGLIEYEETVILFSPVWPNSPGHFLPETGIGFLNHQQNAFSLLRKSSWAVSWNTSHLLSKMKCSTQGKHLKGGPAF